MVVAGSDDVDEVQSLGRDDGRRHANVLLVGGGVFLRQGIGEVGIENGR